MSISRKINNHGRFTGITQTKTYTYFFEPIISIYHEDVIYKSFFLFKNGLRVINVFLEDTGLDRYKLDDHAVHVLCQIQPNGLGKRCLSDIMKSKFFRGCYVLDENPFVVVIVFQPMFRNAYDSFLNSEYSKMIKPNILKAGAIKRIFCKGKEDEPNLIYKILSNDESLINYWQKLISPDDEDAIIDQAASRIYIEDEVTDIQEYYRSIKDDLGEFLKLKDLY